ncbi:HAD superfamily hydrolase (TIGR01509 family)/HAD superfamily hydrolase (TIGR01549 family)/beta-phosphoglucomutase family hydrolase [Pontibacter ummariensis]|uniref:Beta-phosphoglucomutase n=1 Tax=Pontibacter ummariensis TaxID=1610492 RepID=A0A239K2C0_9BACT|nr:HAD family phosphatase [Pontibacter ummariensis]PRY06843.1 HAD superfamily hydrolase (TIGR01509 family)/HAD superfamily hydrolase (TIGR01549 family)/beta-phosphoglucomutase family hydrolase [Pontibacter ummariensis]SNT12171.1 haloacid dehalogenase superfamily, subfamily IA, variant 3 with third motif having DD or ED/haloacid dehalogenase superfamily, subfamily IA, variant 1 with third motif having Dx(3-4)D or Dx(3-4)E/beta-phosphoglucomutase family hydrolase [Pontibacter ummariensis]
MNNKTAFLFDLNGTVIDDMHYHAEAWHEILTKDLGADLTWDEVKKEMYGKNREVLERIFGKGHFSDDKIERLSLDKEKYYQKAYKPHLKLIAGLQDFLAKADTHGIKMAIASAAITGNIDFVVDNVDVRHYFDAIVSADDVSTSKPDPETFLKAAEKLQTAPKDCLVFEDAPKGVEAAQNAGMRCVVITTAHPAEDFKQYDNVVGFIADYTDPYITNYFSEQE